MESPTKAASPSKSVYPHTPGILAVVEEEDTLDDHLHSRVDSETQSTSDIGGPGSNADEVHDLVYGSGGLSSQNAVLLSKDFDFVISKAD